jgi:hypothetical protein
MGRASQIRVDPNLASPPHGKQRSRSLAVCTFDWRLPRLRTRSTPMFAACRHRCEERRVRRATCCSPRPRWRLRSPRPTPGRRRLPDWRQMGNRRGSAKREGSSPNRETISSTPPAPVISCPGPGFSLGILATSLIRVSSWRRLMPSHRSARHRHRWSSSATVVPASCMIARR